MKLRGLSIWGDSIAKGVVFDEQRGRYAVCRDNCVSRLSRDAGVDVENFSVMGNTTEQGLRRMEGQPLKPGNLAVIEFGGNDCDLDWAAACEHPEVEQHGRVPLEAFGENLRAMVRRVRDGGMIPALVTPPPLVAQRYFDWVSRKLDKARILNYLGDVEHIYRWQERYALAVAEIGSKLGCTLLNLREAFLVARDFKSLLCVDGIHPTPEGHKLIWGEVSRLMAGAQA